MIGSLTLALAVVALVLIYIYFTSTFNYWRDRGVVFVKPYPVVGSMWRCLALQEHMCEFFRRVYFQYPDQPYVGFYQGRVPSLLLRDTDLIKDIVVKDFWHFSDHGFKFSPEADPLMTRNVFHMEGQPWKEMRIKLTPTFTSGRMKSMFPLVLECSENLQSVLEKLISSNEEFEVKDLMARYTTDVIASSVFGITCDSVNNPNDLFRVTSRRLIETDLIQGLKVAAMHMMPGIADILKIKFFKKECEEYFQSIVSDVLHMRAKLGKTRKDFMQLLIELKDTGKIATLIDEEKISKPFENYQEEGMEQEKFSELDVLGQALAFFFAGFETSSSALSFALFELARRPNLQRIARQNIEEVLKRHDGQITYQSLKEMTYLDWILQETLRKYPTLSIFRVCTKNYKLPGSDLTLEKGTPLIIPLPGLHYDPQYFPNPTEFIPERFADEELVKKTQYIFMPFGEGPRQCIGMRFGRMQSKLGLLSVLRKFDLTPSSKTKYPLTMDPRQFLITSKYNVFVNFSCVKNNEAE